MLRIATILHPTDFSAVSKNAYRVACSLARDHGARLVVVHVVADLAAKEVVWEFIETHEDYQHTLEDKLHMFATPDPSVPIDFRLEHGHAARQILHVAQDVQADLIVMGTHGRTGLQRFITGSVAEEVQRKATCAVLTIKLPPKVTVPYRYLLPENETQKVSASSA